MLKKSVFSKFLYIIIKHLSGSSASWWSDQWAETLLGTMDSVTPQVFDLYFTADENSKRPDGLERVRVSLEKLLADVRKRLYI